jgi:23S rRNA (guanosine2251-2'-O)-methyltransferase
MNRSRQRRPRDRQDRYDHIYGINPVIETLKGRRSHRRLYVRDQRRDDKRIAGVIESAQSRGIAVESVDQHRLDALTDRGNHQGVVLETGPFPYTELDEIIENADQRPILVLDHLQDPQNLATLIRSAAAIDIAGIVIQSDRSAQVTPAVVRSSAGLVEKVSIARVNNTRRAIDDLKEHGYWAIAVESTDQAQDIYLADIPTPVALVIGAEERGVSSNVINSCDLAVVIPMPGRVESLNAAVAGSVALFEIYRRSNYSEM